MIFDFGDGVNLRGLPAHRSVFTGAYLLGIGPLSGLSPRYSRPAAIILPIEPRLKMTVVIQRFSGWRALPVQDLNCVVQTAMVGKNSRAGLLVVVGTVTFAACAVPARQTAASHNPLPMVLPYVDTALLVRTDFSDDAAWREVCAAATAPVDAGGGDSFTAAIECVSDSRFDGLTVDSLLSFTPRGFEPSFVFLADAETIGHVEHPIVVVDLNWERGRTFKVVPSEIWAVENNLSLANMDFADLANSVDSDGLFRGFH